MVLHHEHDHGASTFAGDAVVDVTSPGVILAMYAQILVQDPIDHELHSRAVPKAGVVEADHGPGIRGQQ